MRISKEVLKKVQVTHRDEQKLDLINVQTGIVEESIVTRRVITLSYKGHKITLTLTAKDYGDCKTYVNTNVFINFESLSVYQLAALLTVYKTVYEENKECFDHLDMPNFYRQQKEREAIRQEIIKQEQRYERKLMMDEIKRLAKENVDSRRPPITATLPKTKVIAIETTEEVNDAIK